MDIFPITGRDAATERPHRSRIRKDGTIRIPPPELGRAGLSVGDAVEVAAGPEGVRAVAVDPRPRKLYVELTTRCNLDCPMCIRHSQEDPGGDMTAATFERLLEQLADLPSVSTLSLSGYGEAMSHPGFSGMVERARDSGVELEVATNATLLDQEATVRLIEADVARLCVSIDGLGDRTTRLLHPDSTFPQVRKHLSRLRQEKRERHVTRPEVTVVFVATRANVGELPALKRLAAELDFTDILVTNVVPHTRELADQTLYRHWTTTPGRGRPSPLRPRMDLPLTDPLSAGGVPLETLRKSGAHLRLNGRDLTGGGPRCRFIHEGRFAVRWDGGVAPCLPLMHTHACFFHGQQKRVRHFPVGNVNEQSLRDVWESEGYRGFRRRVREFDFAPCFDCAGCDLRETNERDCVGDEFPRCGECLWAHGLVQCP